MPSATEDYALTEEQKQFWLEHGFIKVPKCFSRETAEEFTASIWTRLGVSKDDKNTWPTEKINMPGHTIVTVKDFAPKAWAVMSELVGGEDKMADWCHDWKDGFIVNLGEPDFTPDMPLNVRTLNNWHCDGDWFVHFLDSPEQALLVIPIFTDIVSKGGGTVICTDGIGLVAKHLYNHPNGTTPWLGPRNTPDPPGDERRRYWNGWVQNPDQTRDETFHEATGEPGDVYLLHPFMLHSASRNLLRNARIITNPPVALKAPFNYHRPDGNYSLVEQKTLRDLGRPEGLPEWEISSPRERLNPQRVQKQAEMKKKEVERLENAGIAANTVRGAKVHEGFYPS